LLLFADQQLSDCFLVHFTPTQTCTEAFDKFFRSFVSDKQYSNACRYAIYSLITVTSGQSNLAKVASIASNVFAFAVATWLSVCLSVAVMYCAQTTESIIM